MGADILLEVMDHLLSMVKVLDGEEDGHGECEQCNQSYDDLKTEAFIKFYLFHIILDINCLIIKFDCLVLNSIIFYYIINYYQKSIKFFLLTPAKIPLKLRV